MYTYEKSRKSIASRQNYCDYRLMYVYKWKVREEHCIMPEILWLQTNLGIQIKSQGSTVLCQKHCVYRLMYVYNWKVKEEHCIMPEILWLQTNICIQIKNQRRALNFARNTVITY